MEFIDLRDMKLEEKHPLFFNTFGHIIYYNMCNGGFPTYTKKGIDKDYRLNSLTHQQIDELMTQSEKEGKDYLFEAVKHDIAEIPYGCWS